MNKILVLCAHPDDESLGIGGSLALHAAKKDEIKVIFFCDGESSRGKSEKIIQKRQNQAKNACKILGIKHIKFLEYPDERLDTISILELVQQIEKFTHGWKPDILYTHFQGDINQDHKKIFEISMIYARPRPNYRINKILCYETPSSTDWGVTEFRPNVFVDVSKVMKKKISAIKKYKGEIQKFPHPRSVEAIINRAKFWGSKIGFKNAEALLLIRELR